MLGDAEISVRVTAAMALGNMGAAAQEAVPALIRALKDQDSQVRNWAATALGSIGPAAESAVPALKRAARIEGSRPAAEEAIRKIRGISPDQPLPRDEAPPEN
jgi:HEAT repeat protein